MRKSCTLTLAVNAVSLFGTTVASTNTNPNGPSQPSTPGTTCGSPDATASPGNAANANGSPFNPSGQAGTVYAGNPGTASSEHSNSTHAVSQYDIACFQVSSH